MDVTTRNDICGETKTTGSVRWVCDRTPHVDIRRERKRNHRDGVYFFDEPPPESHRFVNLKKVTPSPK